jgi:hypothetical protein
MVDFYSPNWRSWSWRLRPPAAPLGEAAAEDLARGWGCMDFSAGLRLDHYDRCGIGETDVLCWPLCRNYQRQTHFAQNSLDNNRSSAIICPQ